MKTSGFAVQNVFIEDPFALKPVVATWIFLVLAETEVDATSGWTAVGLPLASTWIATTILKMAKTSKIWV